MNRFYPFLCAGLALFLVAPVRAGQPVETIRNQKVVVATQTLSAGQNLVLPAKRPAIVVLMDGGSIEISPKDGQAKAQSVKRGDVLFQLPRGATIKNAGQAELRIAQIDYLGSGGAQTWGTAGLAPDYKLLFEDSNWRIYDIKNPAGATEPLHSHHDRVVVCLSGAQLEHTFPDGRKETATLKTDEIAWRLAARHVGHNIGTTDLWVIAIEPK